MKTRVNMNFSGWTRSAEAALPALGLLFCVHAGAAENTRLQLAQMDLAQLEIAQMEVAQIDIPDDGRVIPADTQELFLDVSLNMVHTGRLARLEMRGRRLWIGAATLRDLGLRLPEDMQGMIALDTILDLRVEYDAMRQHLNLQAPVSMLDRPTSRLYGQTRLNEAPLEAGQQLRGLTYNYDLYGQYVDSRYSLSAWQELRLNGIGPGMWTNTFSSRAYQTDNGVEYDHVRLDTAWFLDFPSHMLSLTVGDTLTGALSWSRPTRIGGIRISRNFALQPYRITAPLVQFQGEATLPSTVDLYINGLRQSSQAVQPGQFELTTSPLLNGTGHAQMVITDINGQQRNMDFALYGVPNLLQAGMADYSVEVGKVRRGYGVHNWEYADDAMFSGTWRYGLSNRTTVETHGEATRGLHQYGVGGSRVLGQTGGVINFSAATSRYDGQRGEQYGIGYQWNSRRFNISLNSQRRDQDYRDVASLYGARLAKGSDQVYMGANTTWGNIGLGYVRQDYFEGARSRFVNVGWFKSFNNVFNVSFNAVVDLGSNAGNSYSLSFMLPYGDKHRLSSHVRHRAGHTSFTTTAVRQVPIDIGGWGWRVDAGQGDSQALRAQVSQLGRYGQWMLGFNRQEGSSTSYNASLSGGLLWAGGGVWAMRKADDAFALVSTDGMADVPVKLENRLVGRTNDKGYLLVNRLNPYQRNRISIDAGNLPPNIQVKDIARNAVPERNSGVLTQFKLQHIMTAQAAVQDAEGSPLPAGNRLLLAESDGSEVPVTVGYDGFIYLENPQPGMAFRSMTKAGECQGYLPDALSADIVLQDIGVLVCD